jgi:ATP synthase protein I
MARKSNKGDPFLIAFGIYGAVGFQLSTAVIGGLLLGGWFDQKYGTSPWLTLLGLILGSVGGFYNLIRILTWNQKRKQSRLGAHPEK